VTFERLLETSRFVSIHLARTSETLGLVDARALARLPAGAVLVNASRGGIVDEDALAEALRSGRLFAAGLDVYAREPLPSTSPLLELPNVVLTPHVGSASVATRIRMADLAVENLLAGLEGRALPHRAQG
jgi:glyoxylate reductase